MSVNTPVSLNAADFDATVGAAPGLVLVDFYATWCGPCLALAPVLDELAAEVDSLLVVKVDIDQAPEIAARYGVRAVPTLLFFRNGEVVERTVGAKRKRDLLDLINDISHLEGR